MSGHGHHERSQRGRHEQPDSHAQLDDREEHVGDPRAPDDDSGHGSGHGEHGATHVGGHGAGHGDHAAMFRDGFWLSVVLSVPVVSYSHMVQGWFGYTAPSFPALSTVVVALNAQLLRRIDLQRDTAPSDLAPATA